MNPQDNTQSFGSFGNVAPDAMEAIKNALSRRSQGTPVPALDTQSSASPTASPLPAEPSAGSSQSPNALPQSPLPNSAPTGNPEAKMIVGALRERLKAISTTEVGGIGA